VTSIDQPAGHGSDRVTLWRWLFTPDGRRSEVWFESDPPEGDKRTEVRTFLPADSLDQRLARSHGSWRGALRRLRHQLAAVLCVRLPFISADNARARANEV